MKRSNLKFITLLVAAAISIPSISVMAEDNTSTAGTTINTTQQEQQLDAKEKVKEEKSAIKEKRNTIKQNHENNLALRKEISEKKATVKSIRKEIKDNKKVLTQEDKDKIAAQRKIIDDQIKELESTKGTIKDEYSQIKTAMKNKDFTAAETHLDNIISIQNNRTDGLKKLSADMDTIISILQTASANATSNNK